MSVDNFFSQKYFAVVGVSQNSQKFGTVIFNKLKKQNFEVFPVNPKYETLSGEKCFTNIESLPASVSAIIFVTPKEITESLVNQAIKRGIKHIWIQQGAASKETILNLQKNSEINIIATSVFLCFLNLCAARAFFSSMFVKIIWKI